MFNTYHREPLFYEENKNCTQILDECWIRIKENNFVSHSLGSSLYLNRVLCLAFSKKKFSIMRVILGSAESENLIIFVVYKIIKMQTMVLINFIPQKSI